jgi:hypothetical protein
MNNEDASKSISHAPKRAEDMQALVRQVADETGDFIGHLEALATRFASLRSPGMSARL